MSLSTSTNTNILPNTDATPANVPLLQFPNLTIKLDRNNYFAWRGIVLSTLEAFDLDSFVTTEPQKQPEETADVAALATYTAWRKKDRLVLVWIRATLSDTVLISVARATTSHGLWAMIQNLNQSETLARLMQLKTQLQSLSKVSLSMAAYIEKKEIDCRFSYLV